MSEGIDVSVEYVTLEQDLKRTKEEYARESPIGLGYRVPLVIASPWSRGGAVCSQVFDHTSIIQFMEKFLRNKTGKKIEETNISAWRRTVCGDLTSVFKPYNGEKITTPSPVEKESFYENIHKAQFKKDPSGYKKMTDDEIRQVNEKPSSLALMPRQEKGTRSSCALPYQLYADGKLSADRKTVVINFAAKNEVFGKQSAGSPFNVYAKLNNDLVIRNYAVAAGSSLQDSWSLIDFENKNYYLQVNGPNGFFREFRGDENDPPIDIQFEYEYKKRDAKKLTGNIELKIVSGDSNHSYTIEIKDNAYNKSKLTKVIGKKGAGKETGTIILDLSKSFGWYDFTIKLSGADSFEKRYAGRVETGEMSRTDPSMGNLQ